MQTLLQSDFLRALSYSLIASIWQMAIVWLAAILVLRLFKFSSTQKFNVAFIAQLTGFVLFVTNFIDAYNNTNLLASSNFYAADLIANLNSFVTSWMPYTAIVYLVVLIFKLTRFVFAYNEARSLKKYGLKKIAPAHRIFVQQTSRLFSISKHVSIYLSSKINCPLTIGFLKPVILIPVAAINHLTTEQMEAVILHELAHIKRADYLLFMLQNLIDKIFFFNIFSIMLSRIIERERENACDDWVLQFRYNSMHYAEALFKLGRLKAMPALALPLAGKKENLLLPRIKRLLHNPQKISFLNTRSFVLSFVSLLMMILIQISSSVKLNENKITIVSNELSVQPQPVVITEPVKNEELAKAKINRAAKKAIVDKVKQVTAEEDKVTAQQNQLKQIQQEMEAQKNALAAKQNYLVAVHQKLDSLKSNFSTSVNDAVNSQIVVTPEILNKAISYQNFKQIENMLAATGNTVKVTETPASKNSYRKQITIEATDKEGNKHIYNVIVELYQ